MVNAHSSGTDQISDFKLMFDLAKQQDFITATSQAAKILNLLVHHDRPRDYFGITTKGAVIFYHDGGIDVGHPEYAVGQKLLTGVGVLIESPFKTEVLEGGSFTECFLAETCKFSVDQAGTVYFCPPGYSARSMSRLAADHPTVLQLNDLLADGILGEADNFGRRELICAPSYLASFRREIQQAVSDNSATASAMPAVTAELE